jgi:hypothetical protein
MLDDESIDARPYSGCRQSNRLPCIDDASRRHANSQLETVSIHRAFYVYAQSMGNTHELFLIRFYVAVTCLDMRQLVAFNHWRFILKSFIDNTLLPALTVFALFAYLVSVFK